MTRLNTIKTTIEYINELVENTIQYAIDNNLQDTEAFNEVLLKAERCVIDAEDLVSGKSENIVTFKQMDTAENLNIIAYHLVHDFLETVRANKKTVKTVKTEKPAG